MVAAPPPNKFDVGLLSVLGVPEALLKSPPVAGAEVVFAPPNKPPVAGADEVAGVEDALLPPNRLEVAGVVELLPLKRLPPAAAGVLVEAPPPKRPPGFEFCPPNKLLVPGNVVGVDDAAVLAFAPVEPPTELKEKVGVPVAAPKRPPDAGAVVVVFFEAAPDELGVPKLNDMMLAGDGDQVLDS